MSLNICSGKIQCFHQLVLCVGQTWLRVISEREKTAFKLQHFSCLPIHKRKTRSSLDNAKGLTVHRQANRRTVTA